MTQAVSIERLSVRRDGELVVHEVDLVVPERSWFGLIGANGSGKTSLLRAIAGRLPIASGRCMIDGLDLSSERGARARRFGFAPPADRLPDSMRVDNCLQLAGGTRDDALTRIGPLRKALGVDALLHRWIGDCSAGMRQRIAIALAFSEGRRLVILDEPFNWLDPVAAYDIKQALRSMVDDGLTLLTALHDLSTLVTACDTGLMLADGRVALTIDRPMLANAAEDPGAFEKRTIDLLRSARGRSLNAENAASR